MPENFSAKLLAFLAGLISTAFGAGITFALWSQAHPSKTDIAETLGCAVYGSYEKCEIAKDAKEARRSVMALREDIKELRRDLARGFGRAYAETKAERDSCGEQLVRLFRNELAHGVPPEAAFQNVIASDCR